LILALADRKASHSPPSLKEDQRSLEPSVPIRGPTRRDRSNIAVARFLDMPRRIAQERVPTAFNVGSRDVTWASQPTPLIPFRVFSRVSRAPFLRQSGVVTETQFLIGLRDQLRGTTNSEGQVKYCRGKFFGHATPDRAGACPYRVQCRVARCDMDLPAHTSHPLSRLFACFAGPIP
jgi:hypothetical protein